MKVRLLTGAAVVGVLAATLVPAHAASTPVLDGKKVTKLSLAFTATAQSHDSSVATDTASDPTGSHPVDRANCTSPRCAALTFVYKPAKGVAGNALFTLTWTSPTDDLDLYVAEVSGGARHSLAMCAGSSGTSEKIYVKAGTLVPGHTYALVADFYRTVVGTGKATVELPGVNTVKASVPATADEFTGVNCTL